MASTPFGLRINRKSVAKKKARGKGRSIVGRPRAMGRRRSLTTEIKLIARMSYRRKKGAGAPDTPAVWRAKWFARRSALRNARTLRPDQLTYRDATWAETQRASRYLKPGGSKPIPYSVRSSGQFVAETNRAIGALLRIQMELRAGQHTNREVFFYTYRGKYSATRKRSRGRRCTGGHV